MLQSMLDLRLHRMIHSVSSIFPHRVGLLNNRRAGRSITASLLVMLILASWGHSGWIYTKAYLAQILIEHAWQQTLKTGENTLPWSWADTWPVARIQAPSQGVDWIVLAGAHGSSLAFSPGHIDGTALPEHVLKADDHRSSYTSQHIVLSGHRDTHFAFLQHLKKGDMIRLQRRQGDWLPYQIDHTEVKNIQHGPWLIDKNLSRLSLITCYPFDALVPGGSERFVAQAIPI